MAAFNFPNSPSTNDIHTENNVSWKWNGTVWKKVASPDTIAKADSKVQVVDAGTGGYITVETDGTQRLRVQNSGAIVTGILTATSFKGDGSALTGISGVTINNNANNRVITGSGTANTLEAETSLEWNGTETLKVVHGSSYPDFRVQHSAGGGTFESFRCGNGPFRIGNTNQSFWSAADDLAIGGGSGDRGITIYSGSSDSGVIAFADGTSDPAYRMGQIIYGHGDNSMTFRTNGNTERLRIDSNGVLTTKQSNTNATSTNWNGAIFSIQNTHDTDNNSSVLYFMNSATGVDCAIQGIHEDAAGTGAARRGHLQFGTSGANSSGSCVERLRIDSSGRLLINNTSADGDNKIQIYGTSDDMVQIRMKRTNAIGSNAIYGGLDIVDNNNADVASIRAHNEGGATAAYIAFKTYASGGSLGERLRITSSGQLLIGTTSSSDRFHLLKSHNGHTRLVVQNNWGSNATAQLKLISPTDEFQLIKYASGDAALNLSNSANIYFSIAGSERLRINSNGDMGLGVTPSSWKTGGDFRALQVGSGVAVIGRGSGDQDRGGISVNHYHNTSDTAKYIANGHANYLYMNDGYFDFRTAASGSANATISWTTPLRITSAGRTELRKDSECLRLMPTTSGNAVYMEFYDDGNSSRQGFFGFGSNTETTSTMHMHNNRNGQLEFRTNNTVHFRINNNGDLQGTDTSISSLSDSRLKKNVADFVYDLSKFKQFKPKTFEWINTDKHSSGTQRGFIAQDLEGVDAELTGESSLDAELQASDITTLGSDKAKTARLGKNDTIYVSVIQQLITKIETLETKVAALESA